MFIIKEIETYIVQVPLKVTLKMSGVHIKHCDNMVVKVTSTDGTIGWGEAPYAPFFNGETSLGMCSAVAFMKSRLIGVEILSTESIKEILSKTIYGNSGAKSAIDMALYDLYGKTTNKQLFEILGGSKRDKVPMIWLVAGGENEFESLKEKIDLGFVSFKVKVGTNNVKEDIARASKAQTILKSKYKLSADANQGFDKKEALEFAKRTGEIGLDWYEQPVDGKDINTMIECNKISKCPIGVDEGIHNIHDIQKHFDLGAAGGGSLKLIKFGGVAQLYEAADLMVSLGMSINLAGKAANTSIGSAAIAHFTRSLPSLDWDASLSSQYLADDIVTNPVQVREGHIITPEDGPGLGIRIDETKLNKYLRHSNLF
tara:strand:+ start:875 stop:1987 length:1113 start_codon:yes stop_codon:yes gene_type:complete